MADDRDMFSPINGGTMSAQYGLNISHLTGESSTNFGIRVDDPVAHPVMLGDMNLIEKLGEMEARIAALEATNEASRQAWMGGVAKMRQSLIDHGLMNE